MTDEIDLAELLDLLDQLLDFTRAGTFDEAPGESEVFERATSVLRRYRPVT